MRPAFIIFADQASWHVGKSTESQCELLTVAHSVSQRSPTVPVTAVVESLRRLGHRGEGILLGLPSIWCLCAGVDEMGLRHRSRDETLRFRLEERLPLALEEMAADFIPGNGGSLGVAVPADRVECVLEELETSGINVLNICPTALLVAHYQLLHQNAGALDGLLCALNDRIELLEFVGGRVCKWASLLPEPAAIRSHVLHAAIGRTAPLRLGAVGLEQNVRFAIADLKTVELIDGASNDTLELAAFGAGAVLGEGLSPVELRRGKLAPSDSLRQVRGPLCAALTALVALSICLAMAMLWRTARCDRLLRIARDRQEQAFHQALPSQTPPPFITSRLQSEEKRLRGLSGTASALPPSLSILPLLRDTLNGLPEGLRFKLLEIRFEPQRLYIEGQTLDHAAADQIAEALRRSTGLVVDPPHTEQPAGEDVTFTISASASSATLVADKVEISQ